MKIKIYKEDFRLINIMIDNLYILNDGLCTYMVRLCILNKINQSEYDRLNFIIRKRLPERKIKLMYCWPEGQVQPRKEFLKNILKELIDKDNKSY